MNEDNNDIPVAYKFRLRMHELMKKAMDEGAVKSEDWDPDVLGYTVFGGDQMLQQNTALVADIVGYELGGVGVTEGDVFAIMYAMDSRRYDYEFNKD